MAANELIGIFNEARAGKKKKKPAPTGIFPPGEGGSLTPQTYKNWKENVQGRPDVQELIDTMRRYNPPSTGRSPQSDGIPDGGGELQMAPDVPMGIEQAGANSAQAEIFKRMALGQTGTGGPEARAQMGQFRDQGALDEDTNLGIVGRGMGANMGSRMPQGLDMDAQEKIYQQQYIDRMKAEGKSPEEIQQYLDGIKMLEQQKGRSPQSIPELSRPSNTMGSGAGSLYKEAMSPEALAMLKKIRESETMKLGRDFSRNAVGQPNVTAQSSYAPPISSYSDSVGALTGAGVSEPGKISASTRDVEKEFFPARRRAARTRIKSRR